MIGLLFLLPLVVIGLWLIALSIYNNRLDEREDQP